MAALPSSLQELIDQMEPQVKAAFLDAISDITDETVLNALEEAIKTGNLDHAMSILNLDPVVFAPVPDITNEIFKMAAVLTAEAARTSRDPFTGARVVFRFDARSPPAEEWLRSQSSKLVQGLSDTARATVRQTLATGIELGQNPRTTALDIVGRISKRTGRREGGTIGLTPAMEKWVQNAKAELLSGDPRLMQNYLTRERRDARFDVKVRRAIEAGKPVAAEDVQKMIGRYADSMLQLRGENIARTETLLSLHAGQAEAIRQLITSGKVQEQDVVKIWRTNIDGRERRAHYILNTKKVQYQEPFISPETGAKMMHPGDRTLGAPGQDVINCRCHAEYKVDYIAAAVRKAKRMAV
jgi:hypothetical protein